MPISQVQICTGISSVLIIKVLDFIIMWFNCTEFTTALNVLLRISLTFDSLDELVRDLLDL